MKILLKDIITDRLQGPGAVFNWVLIYVVIVLLLLSSGLVAQVSLKRKAIVYLGSSSNTTAPAEIDSDTVKKETEEWKEIEQESIDKTSARGKQLLQKMKKKIRKAVKAVARDNNYDLVVRIGDIADTQGKTVTDITTKVVTELGTDEDNNQ